MMKQAWRSYLASLHPRNYKKIKNLGFGFIWIWSFGNTFARNIAEDNGADALFKATFWLMLLLPYFLMWWSNLGGRLPMPKQMYLLPMKQPERGKYIHTLLCIKIGFPVLVGLVLQILRGLIYGMEPLRILLCTAAFISFGIGMYVCSSLRSKFDRYIRYAVRGEDGTGKDAFLNWTCMIYSVIYHALASAVEFTESDSLWKAILWTMIPLMIMIIMDMAIIKTRYLWTIVDACNYEENFNILGKVKK